MADQKPTTGSTPAPGPAAPAAPAPAAPAAAPAANPTPTPSAASAAAAYKAPKPNPVWKMMGLPNMPKKLPGRNWLIFWAVTATFSGAIIYDKREKKRATARWSKAVSHLGKELISNPAQMPRKLTIYLESPPYDGLRVAQDHFSEYVKPVLAASGLDWEFVQGRQQGDVRAAVAEKIRRQRRDAEGGEMTITNEEELTNEEILKAVRKRHQTPEFEGVKGDPAAIKPDVPAVEGEEKTEEEKKKEEEEKAARPKQPKPYNTTDDYATASLPMFIPAEFSPSAPIPFPHVLGFMGTFTRLGRFMNRRAMADNIGREVAAVCFATAREYREGESLAESEQATALQEAEKDWHKDVWKADEAPKEGEEVPATPAEKIWPKPVVLDSRIATRMRRFELQPEDEKAAREIVVPEAEIEGGSRAVFALSTIGPYRTPSRDLGLPKNKL
ncbi:mitochondrial import inner membrane translocase subunit Tim54 [Apiospora hydei]|uniref:Mitochondrial import inner membrane translocase subunit TIM54 n=1 Tax=Apiospora hydei TaxID=1337664 RepID=A0ABR1WPV5_9PEZI